MANPKVSINGFGRIGRLVLRAAIEKGTVDVVHINDLVPVATNAHLFKYDSIHGQFDGEVATDGNDLIINGKRIHVTAIKDPTELPHKENGVDFVVESTGIFRKKADAGKHITAGAKKVIVSAPSPDADATIVMGVNCDNIPADAEVLSNASCTTNCLAPVVKTLQDKWGVVKGLVTTIHSYTNDQAVLDIAHKDLRRARAAAINMIPTSTGAAKAIGLVMPELKGKLDGLAVRVPTPNVSIVDFVAELKSNASADEVNAALREAAAGQFKGIMAVCDEPLVSGDFNHNPHSSIVDSGCTYCVDNLVKVLSWYDNEWGYSNRCIDLMVKMSK
ncbi:type I glyceraldehyde-3-phosphate dehydrogenase [bacterium]|nr:type I glyceraldehyde-3-phosphate dehydrogenase [bacterium]